MAKTMTPSATLTSTTSTKPVTNGELGKMGDNLAARCRKNETSLPSEVVQIILMDDEEANALAQEQFEALRRRVERRMEMIVRHFKVDRTKTPQQLLDATGRTQYVDKNVLATMPNEGPEESHLYFFPIKRDTPFKDVPAEFESRNLVPDPGAQAQVNADDPLFADEHPNEVQWGLKGGVASFADFNRWHDERHVDVRRLDSLWYDHLWLAGRRK